MKPLELFGKFMNFKEINRILAGNEMSPTTAMPALARLAGPIARLFTQTVATATLFAPKPHPRTCQTHHHPASSWNIRVKDEKLFSQVGVDTFGAICWPNGADLAPDHLYRQLKQSGNPGQAV